MHIVYTYVIYFLITLNNTCGTYAVALHGHTCDHSLWSCSCSPQTRVGLLLAFWVPQSSCLIEQGKTMDKSEKVRKYLLTEAHLLPCTVCHPHHSKDREHKTTASAFKKHCCSHYSSDTNMVGACLFNCF